VTPLAAAVAARAAASKTSEPTVVLDVGDLLGITDAFVITSGKNTRQVKAIADEVRLRVRESGHETPPTTEGREDSSWLLLDYGDFVVHVFSLEAREHYALERLWADADRVDWDDTRVRESVGT
jgi:ribosome-associated protein